MLWIKALHIIFMVTWFAGLFYLPRLFVYHAESIAKGSESDAVFQTMERKLLKIIMNPAMIVTWICGILLVGVPGAFDWASFWPWVKIACVLGMTWFHMWLGKQRKAFEQGAAPYAGKTYRLMNEVPTVLLIVIVIAVIVRPF